MKLLNKFYDNLPKMFTVIGCCLVIGSLFFVYSSYMSFQDKIDTMNVDISELQEKLNDGKITEADVLSVDEAKIAVNSVDKVGNEIADLQNSYKALVDKDRTSAEEETADYAEMEKISKKFDAYFGDDSDFRSNWYNGDLSLVSGGSWKFASSYSFDGDVISVLWEFVDSNNDILAYVTGNYHVADNVFDNMVKHVTVKGASYVLPTGDMSANIDIDAYGDGVVSMFDTLGIDFTPLTEEQEAALKDAHDAQGQLMDQYLKDKGGY